MVGQGRFDSAKKKKKKKVKNVWSSSNTVRALSLSWQVSVSTPSIKVEVLSRESSPLSRYLNDNLQTTKPLESEKVADMFEAVVHPPQQIICPPYQHDGDFRILSTVSVGDVGKGKKPHRSASHSAIPNSMEEHVHSLYGEVQPG